MSPDQQLRNLWRAPVEKARADLDYVIAACADVAEQYNSGAFAAPDGGLSLRKAIKMERFARAEYDRVMRIYAALISTGMLPPEAAEGQHR